MNYDLIRKFCMNYDINYDKLRHSDKVAIRKSSMFSFWLLSYNVNEFKKIFYEEVKNRLDSCKGFKRR